MKERAERLGGALEVTEQEGGGTRVSLTFNVNDLRRNPSNQSLIEQLSHA